MEFPSKARECYPQESSTFNKRTLVQDAGVVCGTGLRCPTKAYRLLPLPARTKWLGSIAEDTTHFGYRTHRNEDGTELETPSLPYWLAFIAPQGVM